MSRETPQDTEDSKATVPAGPAESEPSHVTAGALDEGESPDGGLDDETLPEGILNGEELDDEELDDEELDDETWDAESVPRTVHDAFFKELFTDPRHVASALRAVTPEPIARYLDWNSLQPDRASVSHDGYQQTQGDLLFRARWTTGDPLYLQVAYEHQSTPDHWMALRALTTVHGLWRRARRKDSKATHLPAVLVYVLYHGPSPWSAPVQLSELVAVPEEIRDQLAPYLPAMRFVLDDLRSTSDESLAARPMHPYPKIGLVLFKHGRADDLPERLSRFADDLAALLGLEDGDKLWREALRYAWEINERVDEDRFIHALRPYLGREVEHTVIPYAQQLRQQGMDKGMKKGVGDMLLRQLQRRFGDIPDEVETRIDAASQEELERWVLRVLDAGSLDQVFEPG